MPLDHRPLSSGQAENRQADSGFADGGLAGSAASGSVQAGTGQAGTGQAGSGQAGSGRHDRRLAPLRRNLSFLSRWLRNPKAVGAVVPSGRSLASAMAAEIDFEAPGAVVELGGGTGNITATLLEAGVAPQDLAVVERDPTFARVIAARLPGVRVLQGDAAELRRLLREADIGPVKAVVSGLPLLTMPDRICLRIVAEAMEALSEDGVLVQFTYGPASPVSRRILARLGLTAERTSWVVDNFPPASVWRYRAAAGLAEKRSA